MAADPLTVVSDITPKWMEWQRDDIYIAQFSGDGSDVTQVKGATPASDATAWVVVDYSVSLRGAGSFVIYSSDSTNVEIDRIEFAARGTGRKQKARIQCSDAKTLSICNSDHVVCHGWIAYKLLKEKESCPQLY